MELPSATQLAEEINSIIKHMTEPGIIRHQKKMKDLSRSLHQKENLLKNIRRLEQTRAAILDTEKLLLSTDAELKTLAEEDLSQLQNKAKQIQDAINESLLEKDPMDERNIILEIRAGAGGDEAGLFAAELLRAYTRYAETHGWNMHTISRSLNEQGGCKEAIAELSGQNVFGAMKYERGVHRVQRVPTTEKLGRVHTSTITVAVLPQAEEIDFDIKPEDLRIDTYRSSGAGGQHVNKTSSAVRVTHLPTNTVVAVQDERSQHKNRAKAMQVLRSRLFEAQAEKTRQSEALERKTQIGTGDRSEKIRTYNFPQDRITDHRIKQSWSNIASVMEGNWDKIFQDLKTAQRDNSNNTKQPNSNNQYPMNDL